MHNQRSGLQHAAAVTQRIHSDPNRRWRSRGVKRDAQDQRGKLKTISANEVYPGPLFYPESPAPTITPSGVKALWLSLKPQQNLCAACLLACPCARERESAPPSCNVGINIHRASGACRGYGAGVEIWQSGCVSRLRECVFVYECIWLHKENVAYNSSSAKVTGHSLMPSAYIITVVQRLFM